MLCVVQVLLVAATAALPAPQLIHQPYYGYNSGIYNQPGYLGQYGSLYSNYYSSPFAYSGLGWGYGSGGALYH